MKTNQNQSTTDIESLSASAVCGTQLEQIARQGAQKMLGSTLQLAVEQYIEQHAGQRDEHGRRLVVRKGSLPARELQTGIGPMSVRQPRVPDRREGKPFTSAILPPYLRRVASIEILIPALDLKGVSTGEMGRALESILGPKAPGLSPANITRLKGGWGKERKAWEERDLGDKHYVYLWADGIYFKDRPGGDRPCLLVLVGPLPDGTKEVVAVYEGERESKLSWREVLRDLKKRGLKQPPKLAIGDGALGFRAALDEVFPDTRRQRCWVHKTANVLDKMPKKVQPPSKKKPHAIYLAPRRVDAEEAFEESAALYAKKFPEACDCLEKDRDVLPSFYDSPAEHWSHIRTTNPIESTLATVRHRTRQTKGGGSREATLTLVRKLAMEARRSWRRLNGYRQLQKVIAGVAFEDGEERSETAVPAA